MLNPILIIALVAAAAVSAATPVAFAPTSRIWLEGDSTLHRYHADAKSWTITATAKADVPERITLTIPVRTLKSGDRALDDNMYKALKAKDFTTIRFVSTALKLKGTQLEVTGGLTVAGVTRPVAFQAEAKQVAKKWQVKGKTGVTMSHFGIKPPVVLGGLIRCADRIEVHFALAE